MVKVRLNVPRVGPAGSFVIGDEIEVPQDEAERMIARGQCEIIRQKSTEKAVKRKKAEKAVR